MFDNIKADYMRIRWINYPNVRVKLFKKILMVFHSTGFQVLVMYRFYRWSKRLALAMPSIVISPLVFFAYLLLKITGKLYGVYIYRDVVIGKGCYLAHFGIKIHGNCRIGENCSIHQLVKIGTDHEPMKGDDIVIEDNVFIGAHSLITENVTIGKGATISAGSIVTNDVSAKDLVCGAKGRVMQHNYDNSSLLVLPVEEVIKPVA